jgi:tetratricopeptide (TPR) repeat protein
MTGPGYSLPRRSMPEHLGLAEAGKVAALGGDHAQALARYREAMRLAVRDKAPEMFVRHYVEASLESLELMEEFDAVLEHCDRVIAHYTEHPPRHDAAWLDLASTQQRRGAVLLKAGRPDAARAALEEALEVGGRIGATLDLARVLHGWLSRSLFVSSARITQEQRRLRYFSVRPDTVTAAGRA